MAAWIVAQPNPQLALTLFVMLVLANVQKYQDDARLVLNNWGK
jgi:hypothetical protein